MLLSFFILLIAFLILFTMKTSILNLWLCLMLSTFATIFIFSQSKKEISFKYFFIQEALTLLLLIFLTTNTKTFIILMLLLMKMASPPFHYWALDILKKTNKEQTNWFLSFTKLVPMTLCFLFTTFLLNFLFFFIFLLSETLTFIYMENLKPLIFMTSNSMNMLFILLSTFSFFLATTSFLFYLLFLLKNLTADKLNKMKSTKLNSSFILNMLSLPPTFFFFFKLFLILLIAKTWSLLIALSLLFSLLMYLSILKTTEKMIMRNYMKKTKKSNTTNPLLFLFIFLLALF